MNTEQQKITVRYAGEDSWNRVVFKGNNGHFYKTTELHPCTPFSSISRNEQHRLFRDIHTTDEFDGEPGWPVTIENFILADEA